MQSGLDSRCWDVLEAREIEYAEARILRALVIPRLIAFAGVVLAVAGCLHLSWRPIVATVALSSGGIVVALRAEWQARRRWTATATDLAAAIGLRLRSGTQPTVRSAHIADARDRLRASSGADRRAP